MKLLNIAAFLGLLLLGVHSAFANNMTVSDYFPESGPEMEASPGSCGTAASQVYVVAGTITVSATGFYELSDAGNLLGFLDIGQGVADIVIDIYQDSFNPENSGANRIASIDEGQAIELETGHSYVLVLQPYCENTGGVFGFVIRGSGSISGAGFETSPESYGEFSQADDSADFPFELGVHAYDVSAPVSAPETGLYYFGDVGINFNTGMVLMVYEGVFNPLDTSSNLVGAASIAGAVTLSKNHSYVFVAVDANDLGGDWQYALFPPGLAGFNESMKGAWVTPGVDGSGVLMDISTEIDVLFFAWFTFPEAVVAQQSKAKLSLQSIPNDTATINASPGSTDQRWLTAFGDLPEGGSFMNIKYENTTGGIFNSVIPKPTTDSNYGTGSVQVIDCGNILISYELPGGLSGSAAMVHAMPGAETACMALIDAEPITLFP